MTKDEEHLRTMKALEIVTVAGREYFEERNAARLLCMQLAESWRRVDQWVPNMQTAVSQELFAVFEALIEEAEEMRKQV